MISFRAGDGAVATAGGADSARASGLSLYPECGPQPTDEIIKFCHDLVTGWPRLAFRLSVFNSVLAFIGGGGGTVRMVRNHKGRARFRDLSGDSVQRRFQTAQRRARVLVFRHGPLVYRVVTLTGIISTGQGSDVKDFANDPAGSGRHHP